MLLMLYCIVSMNLAIVVMAAAFITGFGSRTGFTDHVVIMMRYSTQTFFLLTKLYYSFSKEYKIFLNIDIK